MDINQYLDIFIEESNEHLQSMNDSLLRLEQEPDNIELLNEIFRVSHTLKGMSGTMGFSKIANLTHEMENLLHALRNEKLTINTDIIDVLFECFDILQENIDYIRENGEEGDIESEHLVEILTNIMKTGGKVERKVDEEQDLIKETDEELVLDNYVSNVLKKAEEKGLNAYTIEVELQEACMLKAARAFIIFTTLEKHSEIIQSVPSVEDIEDEKFENSFKLTIISKLDSEKIKKEIELISEIKKVDVKKLELDIEKDKDEKMSGPDKKTASGDTKKEKTNDSLKSNKDDLHKDNVKKKKQSNKVGKTVRVDIDRLDNLMNLVSELIIIKTRMEDIGHTDKKQNMNEAIEYLERITTNLHDAVMKVRMVPIERVFNRFPRMVRDLSKELGKNINLEMYGEETEVDRTVIDEIGDPLIHLIRNSIDHGIEKPEERENIGKPEYGVVKLQAYPDGNNVVIEVSDDGAGIDHEKIKDKAISKGVISEEKAEQLSKDEIAELLFEAGFSTADKVTDVSGRGVGLDVVKSKIESIGGIVEITTLQGKGTKFTIRIPLTLAIIQALLIKLKDEIYAIPLSSIKEISPILKSDIRKVQNNEVVLFRNKTLPIVRLNRILGLPEDNESEELITVIVKKGEKEAGLIVDNLIGQQEIVIKSLGKFLAGIKHIAGATILGNGKISLILDINSLF